MSVVFFDLETGGLLPQHPIIQIAAVAVSDDFSEEQGVFETKILFEEHEATREALDLNHYNAQVWAQEGVHVVAALDGLAAFLKKHATVEMVSKRTGAAYRVAQVAGHNIVRFDLERLQAEFKKHQLFCPISYVRTLDTLQGSYWFFQMRPEMKLPENFKLGTLAHYFGIEVAGDSHNALTDVRTTVQLARRLTSKE